jgi:hypothetical protein
MPVDPTQKTALDLITGAMRKTGQYAPGEAITAADLNDALDVLNALFDSMSNDDLATFNTNENIVTLTPGQISYTVGDGGDIDIQRPLKIHSAYSRITTSSSTVDFWCEIKDEVSYAQIGLKNQPGPWPKWLFYNTSFPLGRIYFWPVPTEGVEFHFWTDMLLQSVTLTTQLNLPQGYYNYLQFALAEALCVDYGMPVPPDIVRLVAKFERKLKSNNSYIDREISIDGAIAVNNANDAGWILTGGF